MKTYVRKTKDEFQIHGNYTGEYEEVTAYDTKAEARQGIKEYRNSEPKINFYIKKVRIKIAA